MASKPFNCMDNTYLFCIILYLFIFYLSITYLFIFISIQLYQQTVEYKIQETETGSNESVL